MAAGADDQVIVHRNAQTLAGIDDRARDLDVGAAGGGVARRVVVHQDDRRGAQVDRTADHFADMDLRLINRSLAHHLVADQHVAAVKTPHSDEKTPEISCFSALADMPGKGALHATR